MTQQLVLVLNLSERARARASSNPFLLFFTSFFFFNPGITPQKLRLYQKLTLPLSGPPQRHPKQLESHDAAELSFQDEWRLPNLSSGLERDTFFYRPLSQSPPIRRRLSPL